MFQFYLVQAAAAAFLIQNWSRFVTDVTTACKVFGLRLLLFSRKFGIHCLSVVCPQKSLMRSRHPVFHFPPLFHLCRFSTRSVSLSLLLLVLGYEHVSSSPQIKELTSGLDDSLLGIMLQNC